MSIIVSHDFATKLGTIRNWLESDSHGYTQQQDKLITRGHCICCQSFDIKQIWAPDSMKYETSVGWRWFIEKTNSQKEELTIICKLIDPSGDTEWDPNSGENLDAIEIENKTEHLHIGTEDGEMLHYRAEMSDWMPGRFKDELGFYKSFTEYIDFGFKTSVPLLGEGEKIYFHYMVATNVIKPSKDYPEERDLSTGFAVDQSKKFLDNKLAKASGESSF